MFTFSMRCTVPRGLMLLFPCSLILSKQAGESDEGFQRRLKTHGAGQFQAAMWQVHDAMSKTAVWNELTESQRKLAMQVTGLVPMECHLYMVVKST